MQGIRRIVDRELIRFSVERELAIGDAIRIAAHGRSEVRLFSDVAIEAIEAEDDIALAAGAVGHPNLGERGAEIGDFGDGAFGIREREELDRRAVRKFSVFAGFHRGPPGIFRFRRRVQRDAAAACHRKGESQTHNRSACLHRSPSWGCRCPESC